MSVTDLTIEAFEALDFDAAAFDHEAHVFIARELVCRFGQEEAGNRFVRAIRTLTDRLGVPDKYHETITRFYILAIAERTRQSGRSDWPAFKAANADLFDGSLLRSSYSAKRLASAEARERFLLPDRRHAA